MVVYADILVIVNFIVDYFLLKASAAILHIKPPLLRQLSAAAIGGLSSLYIFAPDFGIFVGGIYRSAVCAVMVLCGFGFKSTKCFLRAAGVLFLVTCGYGGIMTAVYLRDVVADYCAEWTQNDTLMHHRYGCSGIDGISFGPEFGAPSDSKSFLNIAYGIYGDVNRTDNDHQVIVHYDITHWAQWAQPLRQEAMHRSGPAHCDAKYFIYTGNTEFGVQNLEYDPFTGNWLMCVYRGKKPQFPNVPMYIINGAAAPEELPLRGST